MKNMLLLLLLAFITGNAVGQTDVYKELMLSIEKKTTKNQTTSIEFFQFIPGKLLQIKTVDGRYLNSDKYFLQDSAIIMIKQSNTLEIKLDTISLKDIASVKGKVYNNNDQKLLGVILTGGGLLMGFYSTAITIYSGNPVLMLIMIPSAGITLAGINMMGAKRFNTIDKWELRIIER
jgi:hypothetical protein